MDSVQFSMPISLVQTSVIFFTYYQLCSLVSSDRNIHWSTGVYRHLSIGAVPTHRLRPGVHTGGKITVSSTRRKHVMVVAAPWLPPGSRTLPAAAATTHSVQLPFSFSMGPALESKRGHLTAKPTVPQHHQM